MIQPEQSDPRSHASPQTRGTCWRSWGSCKEGWCGDRRSWGHCSWLAVTGSLPLYFPHLTLLLSHRCDCVLDSSCLTLLKTLCYLKDEASHLTRHFCHCLSTFSFSCGCKPICKANLPKIGKGSVCVVVVAGSRWWQIMTGHVHPFDRNGKLLCSSVWTQAREVAPGTAII